MVTEVEIWSVRVAGWSAKAASARRAARRGRSRCRTAPSTARRCWSRCPQAASSTRSADALVKAGASVRSTALVGSHATRYTVAAAKAPARDRRAEHPDPPERSNVRATRVRSRAPACSTSRPMCPARAARRASPRCSSCRRTRRRSGRARRRSRPISAVGEHLRGLSGRRGAGAARGDRPRVRARSRPHRLRRGLRRSAQPAGARLSRRRRRGDPHHARLPGLSDRDARRRRDAGGRAGEELHRRRRRDPRAR